MSLAEIVKDLNEAIRSLPALLETVSSLPIVGWVVLIILFLWFLVNKDFSHIFEALDRKEKRKIDLLDSYVASPDNADASAVKAVRDLRDAHYFRIATGIYAENRLRGALIKLHDATSHLITWRQIQLALPHLDVTASENVNVKPSAFLTKLGYGYNVFVAYLFLFLAAALVSIVILAGDKTLTSFILGFGGALLLVAFALFAFSQNWPFDAAKKIKAELESQTNDAAET